MPSDQLKAEMIKERSSVAGVDLLMIENITAFGSNPIKIANNTVDVTFKGNLYKAVPFSISRGSEGSAPSEITINIIDTDQSILFELEKIPPVEDTPTNVTFWLVSDLNLDAIELTEVFELRSFEVDDSGVITMSVLNDPFLGVTIPAHRFTPDLYPGIHPTIEGE